MGKYKDKKGTTLMGDILRKVGSVGRVLGPEALKVIGTITGMSGLTKLGEALDNDPAVSPQLKDELMEIAVKRIELDIVEEQERTKRWSADMSSDSWLSKNVRPMTLISLLLFVFGIIIADSIEVAKFTVDEGYKELLKALLLTTFFAYFGGRAYNKAVKIKNK